MCLIMLHMMFNIHVRERRHFSPLGIKVKVQRLITGDLEDDSHAKLFFISQRI